MQSKCLWMLAALLVLATPAFPCTVPGIATPQQLVEGAALIVHARMVTSAQLPASVARQIQKNYVVPRTQLRFRIVEVLKGTAVADELTFDGEVAEHDDWNEGPVPYKFVRQGGRSGNCIAHEHKSGGEYLLFLNPAKTGTDETWPYWSALAPTNEQVTGSADPWIAWVRQQLALKSRP